MALVLLVLPQLAPVLSMVRQHCHGERGAEGSSAGGLAVVHARSTCIPAKRNVHLHAPNPASHRFTITLTLKAGLAGACSRPILHVLPQPPRAPQLSNVRTEGTQRCRRHAPAATTARHKRAAEVAAG